MTVLRFGVTVVIWLFAFHVAVTGSAFAQSTDGNGKGGGRDRPLDQEMLKRLNARSTDEVDRELFAPEEQRPKEKPKPPSDRQTPPKPDNANPDLAKKLSRELGAAAVSESDNPLVDIARQMRQAEGLLGRADCGPQTRAIQGSILASLDALLESAQKNCNGAGQCNSPGGQPKPSSPKKGGLGGGARAGGNPKTNPKPTPTRGPDKTVPKPSSTATDGKRVIPNPKEQSTLLKSVWGDLPAHERERMQSISPNERFLPKYELEIEEYFRRLAEEKHE